MGQRATGAVRRRMDRSKWFLASLFLLLLAPLSHSNDLHPTLWVATPDDLLQVNVKNGATLQTLPVARTQTLAVNPQDQSLWVVTRQHVFRFDKQGNRLFSQTLGALFGSADTREDDEGKGEDSDIASPLAIDVYDGTAWIARGRQLVHLDSQGHVQTAQAFSDRVENLALDLNDRLWVVLPHEVLQVDFQGQVHHILSVQDGNGPINDALRVALPDRLRDALWVASNHRLWRFSLSHLDASPQQVPLPAPPSGPTSQEQDGENASLPFIRSVVTDPVTGGVWLSTRHTLVGLDSNGTVQHSVSLQTLGVDESRLLGFEPQSRSVWLAAEDRLIQLSLTGQRLQSVDLRRQVVALGVEPFWLAPYLTFEQPLDGYTNNARPMFELGLKSRCNAVPCALNSGYRSQLTFSTQFDGAPLGPVWTLSADHSTATYTPPSRLAEGAHTLTVQAKDRYDHPSNNAASHITVDTVPPRFLSLSPPDHSTLTHSPVNITGSVDDPNATVVLNNFFNLGGTVLDSNPTHFGFQVPMQAGPNTFTLSATDLAGNTSQAQLHLTYDTVTLTINSPVSGATITQPTTTVSGSVQVPTGFSASVAVNGHTATVGANGTFSIDVPLMALGANTLTVSAQASGLPPQTRQITVTRLPPDPASVAPPLSPAQGSTLFAQAHFLFDGSNPCSSAWPRARSMSSAWP